MPNAPMTSVTRTMAIPCHGAGLLTPPEPVLGGSGMTCVAVADGEGAVVGAVVVGVFVAACVGCGVEVAGCVVDVGSAVLVEAGGVVAVAVAGTAVATGVFVAAGCVAVAVDAAGQVAVAVAAGLVAVAVAAGLVAVAVATGCVAVAVGAGWVGVAVAWGWVGVAVGAAASVSENETGSSGSPAA